MTWNGYDSAGEDLNYTWTGDVSGSGPSVTKIFDSEGDRTIGSEVTDRYRQTDTTIQLVEAENPCSPPSAKISGPTRYNRLNRQPGMPMRKVIDGVIPGVVLSLDLAQK